MLAIKRQYKSNIIPLQVPAEPRPGETVCYVHNEYTFTGIMLGTITSEVKRYKVDGKHPIVVEYIIAPEAGQTNLSAHIVPEQDMVWSKQIKPVCPRCQGARVIGVRNGDDSIDCPDCGFVDEYKVF